MRRSSDYHSALKGRRNGNKQEADFFAHAPSPKKKAKTQQGLSLKQQRTCRLGKSETCKVVTTVFHAVRRGVLLGDGNQKYIFVAKHNHTTWGGREYSRSQFTDRSKYLYGLRSF